MVKRILLAELLGGIVLFVWTIISTSFIPLNGDRPDTIPRDKEVHTILKEKITEPGIYFVPDHPDDNEDEYLDYENEPIFTIYYAGTTPGTFMGQMIYELFCILFAPMIAAWLLSVTSEQILGKYSRRVLFVMVLGLFIAVYGDLFVQKPMDRILLTSINHLVGWTLAGLVIAWRIKPVKKTSMSN